jgi:hypothetical protein
LTPGSRIRIRDRQKSRARIRDPGTGLIIPDLIFEDLVSVFVLKILTFIDVDADVDPGSGILSTLDQGYGMKKIGSRFRPDPQHW